MGTFINSRKEHISSMEMRDNRSLEQYVTQYNGKQGQNVLFSSQVPFWISSLFAKYEIFCLNLRLCKENKTDKNLEEKVYVVMTHITD